MSSKITALTTLPSVTSADYLVAARSSDSQNYKLLASSLFSSLTGIGYNTPVYLIDNISSTNNISQRGLKSLSAAITLAVSTSGSNKNVDIDFDETQIDLSNCDNTTSGFLSSVDLTDITTVSGILPVKIGGTGIGTLNDKSVLVTQDSGDSAFTMKAMSASGSLLIGGLSGPEVGTLTAGNNITVTNGDGSITIASTFSTATTNVDMAGFNIEMGNGWISDDGSDGGIGFDSEMIFVGGASNSFFSSSLNVDEGISLRGGTSQVIKAEASSSPASLTILGSTSTTSGGNAGHVTVKAGDAPDTGNGGTLYLKGGNSPSGLGGSVNIVNYLSGTETTVVSTGLGSVTIPNTPFIVAGGDMRLTGTTHRLLLPYDVETQKNNQQSAVTINEISGVITIFAASLAAGTQTQFTVNNSTVSASSRILLTVEGPDAASQTDNSIILAQLNGITSGSFNVILTNIGSADTDAGARKVHFLVIN